MSQFYKACGIDDVSTGSISCLFAATSLGGAVFTAATTLVVFAETDDPGGRRVRIVAQWWRPVASNVAQDVLHWAMSSVLQRWIANAIKMASKRSAFVCHRQFVVVHNLS